MMFLPEAVDYIASSQERSLEFSETIDGPIMSSYKALAKQHAIWLSLGGIHVRVMHHYHILTHYPSCVRSHFVTLFIILST